MPEQPMKKARIPHETIKRIAKEVLPEYRISKKAVQMLNGMAVELITQTLMEAKKFTDYTKRKTVTENDLDVASK